MEALESGTKVPAEETGDIVPAKKRGRPKPRVPVAKAPVKKSRAKQSAKRKAGRKIAESDEDDYVPEKEEPDEAVDVKLEEEDDDLGPAMVEDEDENAEENPPRRKRGKKRPKQTRGAGPVTKKIVRVDPVTGEHKRIKHTHVEPDVDDPVFQCQLVEFKESGLCPKCNSKLVRAHLRHLRLCRGPTEDTIRRNNEREVMAALPPEALSGKSPDVARMKLMARLRKVCIKGLKHFRDDGALFIVAGSTGRDYEVSVKDGSRTGPYSGFPRRCNCIDARTKRHDCKHCSSIILRLGFDLDVTDEEWNGMWRMHLEDALETGDLKKL